MTLEEAIRHAEEKAKCGGECGGDHAQLAEWLKELQVLRSAERPSSQTDTDEWCTDCKEYDHERYCCPRWNRVIRETLKDAQPEIIRCRECKHHIPYEWMFSELWRSQNIYDYSADEIGCEYCDMTMKANDFCSRAERRTDENNNE